MTLKPYPETYESYQPSEERTVIPPVIVRVSPTIETYPTPTAYETRGSYSGIGSGRSSGGSSIPTQEIPKIPREELKPKLIPIPKSPPTQEERREFSLISKGLRLKGKRKGILKRQIIYSPESKIEYKKKTIQEMFKEKKKQFLLTKKKKKEIKEEQIKKRKDQKELDKQLKAYQLYLQQEEKEKPLPIKIKEEISKEKTQIKKIKWW